MHSMQGTILFYQFHPSVRLSRGIVSTRIHNIVEIFSTFW